MGEVTCPRCNGLGDIKTPSGTVTKCFSCGGHGVIEERDYSWKMKWTEDTGSTIKSGEKTPKSKAKVKSTRAVTPKKAVTPVRKPAAPQEDLGRSPLHLAASDGYLRDVLALLENGAEVNARDNDGRTPLHWPCYRGHFEVVQALIAHGADVNATDRNGRTPIKMATIGNRPEIIALLEGHGGRLKDEG